MRLHRSLAGQSICLFRFNRRCTPNHAPTSLRTAPAFKKSLEVTPVILRDLAKHHAVRNASLISHDHRHCFPFPHFDNGKQEQLDREKAQVNPPPARLYVPPYNSKRCCFGGAGGRSCNSLFWWRNMAAANCHVGPGVSRQGAGTVTMQNILPSGAKWKKPACRRAKAFHSSGRTSPASISPHSTGTSDTSIKPGGVTK